MKIRRKIMHFASILTVQILLFSMASCSAKNKDRVDPIDEKNWYEPLRVATYNIEYDNKGSTENLWKDRKHLVKKMFEEQAFDILGMQEPYVSQLNDIKSLLPAYDYVGTTVQGSETADRQLSVTIFYKKDRFEILQWDKFWLSTTPEVLSKGWGHEQYRICIWAKVKDKVTGKVFFFFNTHFAHNNEEARINSATLLLKKIPEIAGTYPFVLTADFNSVQNSTPYNMLNGSDIMEDSYELAEKKLNVAKGSYNNYDPWASNPRRIDHLFISESPSIKVDSWEILWKNENNRFSSDHNPIVIELSFEKDE